MVARAGDPAMNSVRHPFRMSARQAGFTLFELIITMAMTGIIAGMVSQAIIGPVRSYFDSARRAVLTDTADLVLRRLTREVRQGAPNSLRISDSAGNVGTCVSGTCYIEYIATSGGGAFSASEGFFDGLSSCATTPTNCQLSVISPLPSNPGITAGASGDYILIGNTTNSDTTSPLNAYACALLTNCNYARVSSIVGSTVTLAAGGTGFNVFGSPGPSSSRFQVVPAATKAVIYACPLASGTLRRYWNYGFKGTPSAAVTAATGGGSSTIMATNASCTVSYPALAQTFGVLIVSLTLTDSTGAESVTLMREIHVDNAP
jgi:MSHA biogenesis protein MshO